MKRHAPATARNREPLAAVLSEELPDAGLVLEVASGTGEHAVHFARAFPYLQWQPSDADAAARASIAAWRAEAALANLLAPIALDAAAGEWPPGPISAIICINMIHISPVAAAEGLFAGAGGLLGAGAPLVLYGPFIEAGTATAPSNLAFDADLRARDPRWGLREVAWLDDLAKLHGLARCRRVALPANNLALVYRRQ
ncbi:MAG: DUF938 domain-containing protein [Croceibacterium sp.]